MNGKFIIIMVICQSYLGMYHDAIKSLETTLQYENSYDQIYIILAHLYSNLGQVNKASSCP